MENILNFVEIITLMKKNPALFGLLVSIFVFLGAFGIYFLFLAFSIAIESFTGIGSGIGSFSKSRL